MSTARHFTRGLWQDMPVLRLGLGLCPALAVSHTLRTGLGMALATASVLVSSVAVTRLLEGPVPDRARLYLRTAVVAGFVTVLDLVLARYAPQLRTDLGIFVPLVAVNCLVIGGLSGPPGRSWTAAVAAGLGRGTGFAAALGALSAAREILGSGTLWGRQILGATSGPVAAAALPAGGFVAAGLLAGLVASLQARRMRRA